MARKEDAYTMQAANVLEPGYFVESRAALEETIEELQSQKAMRMTHAELEVVIEQQGREIMRRLMQDHLDLRSASAGLKRPPCGGENAPVSKSGHRIGVRVAGRRG